MKRLINLILSAVSLIDFMVILRIGNIARSPEFIETDYFMNSLFYEWLLIILLCIMIIYNLFYLIKDK